MIIVPNLRWRTFRYWAVRATVACGIGSSPAGGALGNFSTDFDLKDSNLSTQPASPLQSYFKKHPVHVNKPNNVNNVY